MRAILICPAERPSVAALYESMPLVLVPMLGKSLLEYWMEHLVARNVSEVVILAADRPEQVRSYVAEGLRWGIKAEVWPATRELDISEARYVVSAGADVECVEVMDCLPHAAEDKLFSSYEAWFACVAKLIPQTATDTRIGVREKEPGVWSSMHDAISSAAQLVPPCWIGKDVVIEEGAVVGPFAIIEDGVCVEKGAEVAHSVVLNGTLVGEWTEVKNSIAWGDMLVHLPDGISTRVPDEFLLSSLEEPQQKTWKPSFGGRIVAAILLIAIAPFAILAMGRSVIRGTPYLRTKTGVISLAPASNGRVTTFEYFEVASRYGWIRRWPQLWDAVCGRFAFIGNRPLTPEQAAELKCDFEKLWLAAPTGVISLADAESGIDIFGEKARAHACYYAVKGDWSLDVSIFYSVVIVRPINAIRSALKDLIPVPVRYAELDGQG